MYFVLFSGTVHPSQAAAGEKFYIKLLPLLQQSKGFVSEIPFASTTDPNGQLLYAAFEDAEAVNRWRTEATHLRIERAGRERVFEGYRIRVGPGVDGLKAEGGSGVGKEEGDEQLMLVYQRPHVSGAPGGLESIVDTPKAESVDWTKLNDSGVWQSEKTVMWLGSWKGMAAAEGFEKAVKRVEGDSVQMVRVVRDYGKEDRGQAPGKEIEGVEAAEDEKGDGVQGNA
jgi:heme-degrading monooxygenase HmoA